MVKITDLQSLLQFEVKYNFQRNRPANTIVFNFDKSKGLTRTIILSVFTNVLDKKEWKDFHYIRVINTRKSLKSQFYTLLDLKKYRKYYRKYYYFQYFDRSQGPGYTGYLLNDADGWRDFTWLHAPYNGQYWDGEENPAGCTFQGLHWRCNYPLALTNEYRK